jgi:hypothetical protein
MRLVALLPLIAIFGCAGHADIQRTHEDIAYRKGQTNVLVVYDLRRQEFGNVSIEYLKKRDLKYGEFGGHLRLCSNQEFLCLVGGIGVAIPTTFSGQERWEFAGNVCRSSQPLNAGTTAVITCASDGWSNTVVYSPSLGITSYTTQAEPGIEYLLVDEEGLFAPVTAEK